MHVVCSQARVRGAARRQAACNTASGGSTKSPRCSRASLLWLFAHSFAPFVVREVRLSCLGHLFERNASGCMLRRVKCRFKGSEGKEQRAQSEQPGAIATRSVLGAASAAVALASLFRPRPRPQEQSRAWTPSTPVRVSFLDWSGATHNVTTRLIHEHTKPRPAKVEARSIVWCRSSQNNSPPRFEVFGLACGRICIDAL